MAVFWFVITLMLLGACCVMFAPLIRASDNRVATLIVYPSLCLGIIALSIGLYLKYGGLAHLHAEHQHQAHKQAVEKLMIELKTPDKVLARLRAQLHKGPNSAKGWYLLGRLHYSMSRFAKAAKAFRHAHQLQPHNIGITMQYAQALFFTHDANNEKKARDLVELIRRIAPTNEAAINLAAIMAYSRHDYSRAIRLWERLLPSHRADSADGKVLLNAIAKAQRKRAAGNG